MGQRSVIGRLIVIAALAACGSKPVAPAPREPSPRAQSKVVDLEAANAAYERADKALDDWRFADAVADLELAAPVFEARLPASDPRRTKVLSWLTRGYRGLGQWEPAKTVGKRLIAFTRELADRNAEADALNDLALVVAESGDVRAAIRLYERALEIDDELRHDDGHPGKSTRLHNLALAYGNVSEYERAIELLERVLARDLEREPATVATANTMHNLALQLRDDGQYERAKKLFGEALRILLTELGSRHPRLLPTLNGLAGTHKLLNDYDKAVHFYKEVLAVSEQSGPSSRAIALSELADIETERKHLREALRYFDESLALLTKMYAPRGHAEIVRVLVKRTGAHLASRDLVQAERDTASAIEMATKLANASPVDTITWLADKWAAAGHPKRAKELRARAARP
jgi:tetratricopeptide (TPR) repeat protein